MRVRRQSFEIIPISSEDGPFGFGHSHHQRVHYRPSPSTAAQKGRPSGHSLSDVLNEVAGLEEPVLHGVPPGVSLQALDQHYRRNQRRPQSFLAQSDDQCDRRLRAFGKAAYGTRIQYQHGSTGLAGRSLPDSLGSRLGSRALAGPRLTDLRNQISNVSFAFGKQVQPTQFGANGFLQKL
jgi:hypothetical protein